jgi:hypothetical protein
MALANVSILLARQGLRVLVVDWDLEAPGLERYFSYFPVDINGEGILRLLVNVANEQPVDYKDFLWTIDVQASHPIAFLPSGKDQNSNYSAELADFDWDGFFEEKMGGDLGPGLSSKSRRNGWTCSRRRSTSSFLTGCQSISSQSRCSSKSRSRRWIILALEKDWP